MTEAEKRRRQLLRQARELYRDSDILPAVHPRYRAAYKSLYGNVEEEERMSQSTIGIRTLIAVMLFAVFVLTDYKGTTICRLSSQEITEQITVQTDAAHFLKVPTS